MPNIFESLQPLIQNNGELRPPQREAFQAMQEFANSNNAEREVGLILPVGCGKSGCIAIAPFAFNPNRVLVVAPNLKIARQLHDDFDPSKERMFYRKCRILTGPRFPEPVEIRGTTSNRDDLDNADVVITNIQQLQGNENRWLQQLPDNYFDLILFDEGHHNVAASWSALKDKFPGARIVNFSATPQRADGQLMAGQIIFSFPVSRAIREGYVKRLKAVVLNPRTLRYVRREGDAEVEVALDEVRRLGEQDADFRRSIVTSRETLATIADASIRELRRLRETTADGRLKIIASALNYEHCRQVVQAYTERGLRAAYVHSREDGPANERVFAALDRHELDVIVQVRKLGEGFDHPFLSVAAVFSLFGTLSPFIQFVGRIMRVIVQNDAAHPLNQGTVVFHAGANVARQWADFQTYSQADQEYFDQLLPLEGLDFSTSNELAVAPDARPEPTVDVRSQSGVDMEEIPLLQDNEAAAALRLLHERGYSIEQVGSALEELQRVPVTRVRQRQAMRGSLDMRVRNTVGRLLAQRGINPEGKNLDRNRLGRTNFVVLKSTIDRIISQEIGRSTRERHEYTLDELNRIEELFETIIDRATAEVFDVN
jgi:superfamily II DNA or RNA helicase